MRRVSDWHAAPSDRMIRLLSATVIGYLVFYGFH